MYSFLKYITGNFIGKFSLHLSSLQTSRVGRLAAFAGSQYTNCSENSDSGEKNGLQEDTPVAEIVYTRLVVSALGRRGRGKGGGEGGEEECDGGFGQERPQNGVKNFKKFRKVFCDGLVSCILSCALPSLLPSLLPPSLPPPSPSALPPLPHPLPLSLLFSGAAHWIGCYSSSRGTEGIRASH